MSDELLESVGGRKTTLMGADPNDPANVIWNFGLEPATPKVIQMIGANQYLWDKYPAMKGKWQGETVNHFKAVEKVLGDKATDLIQSQPRGTCGGRSGSATGDFTQCLLIGSGKRATFKRTSHAAIYLAARKMYGMLNGDWRDQNNDGVAGGSVPDALARVCGYTSREEVGDTSWYGAGSDDLACQLGAGLKSDLAAKIMQFGSDNFITDWAPVRNAAELADGIAAGGIGLGSDLQGFTMTRDSQGFCRPSGQWAHYQTRVGVQKENNRPGFAYWQSWGKDTPSGTMLNGYPGNTFGVDFDVQDQIVKSRDAYWCVVFGFPLFDLREGGADLSWIF